MMGMRTVMQEALFYEFSLERHVPSGHLLRSIERFVELSSIRTHLRPFYSEIGRPSIDPELMIRMLIVGYCFGIRSERRLCEEVTPIVPSARDCHRRRFSEEDRRRILMETERPGAGMSEILRRYGIARCALCRWKQELIQPRHGTDEAPR
jgi:hypothetical protein